MGYTSSSTTYIIEKHPEYGGSAVALNSSINYLGSAMGSAIGGIILFNANSTNVLIYSALGITIIGILLQLLNLSLEKIKNLVSLF